MAVPSVASFGQNSFANAQGEHQQITIGVLDKNFPLTGIAVARFTPDFAWTEVDRPIFGGKIGKNRGDIPEVNLKHRALPKRGNHRPCLKPAVTLAEHNLLTFGMLQINKLFLFTPVSNFKADDVLPKNEAGFKVGNMEFRYDLSPAGFRRSVPVNTHIDTFYSGLWYGNRTKMPTL